MPVNPGRLRERIEIQTGTKTNTLGGPTTTWESEGAFWAAVVQVGASGAGKYAQAGHSDVTHEITIRAGPHLTLGKTLIRWRGQTLQPVMPPRAADHRGRFVTIACKEVPSGSERSGTSS